MIRPAVALCLAALLCASCGPPSVRATSYADSEVPCPGGRVAWNLEVLDQRADREGQEKFVASIRDGLQKSFPGCKWSAAKIAGADTITIEVHRFAARLVDNAWEAAVEWSVRVENASGRTVTEFQANEEVSKLNYRGSDNDKNSLSEAFGKALERTVKGLRAVPTIGGLRPRAQTPSAPAGLEAAKMNGA
jgi:hypothetical protein